jgi:transcriptional regulator with XRE-family HTH domain
MADRFGERLRQVREGASLTQQELADRIGFHKLSVAKLEQGIREPTWPTVLDLADALSVSTEVFRPKDGAAEPRRRGRPRKDEGVEIDLHATDSAPLVSTPGPTPTKKGPVGRLPEAQ